MVRTEGGVHFSVLGAHGLDLVFGGVEREVADVQGRAIFADNGGRGVGDQHGVINNGEKREGRKQSNRSGDPKGANCDNATKSAGNLYRFITALLVFD